MEVIIDHNEYFFGSHGVTTFPITILQPPMELLVQMGVLPPPDWVPDNQDEVQLGMPVDDLN